MSRTCIAAGNWKMHGSQSMTAEMLTGLSQCASDSGADIAVFPPFPYLSLAISAAGEGVRVGAQNVSHEEQGAFTGEVSAAMLKDLGCEMVLVGHSERRSLYHEDNDRVAEKFATALAHDLTPVLCVGETLGTTRSRRYRKSGHRTDRCGDSQMWNYSLGSVHSGIRAGLGHRHRQNRNTGYGAGNSCGHSCPYRGAGQCGCGKTANSLRRQCQSWQCGRVVCHGRCGWWSGRRRILDT